MKCEQVRDLAYEYIDGDLSPEVRGEMAAHTEKCAACRAEIAGAEQAVQALRQTGHQFEPPDVLQDVKARAAASGRRSRALIPRLAFSGAAVVLAAWLGISQLSITSVTRTSVATTPAVESAPPKVQVADEVKALPEEPKVASDDPAKSPEVEKETPVVRTPSAPQRPHRHIARHTPAPRPNAPAPATENPSPEPDTAAPEPTVDYIVVYTPEPPEPEPVEVAATDMVASGAGGTDTTPAEVSAYSIRMVDGSSGDVSTLTVRSEAAPGESPNVTVDYSVITASDDNTPDERRPSDENSSIPADSSARSSLI